MKRSKLTQALLLAVVIAALLWLNHSVLNLTPEGIRNWITGFGWASSALFILLYAVRPLILFPASVLSLAAGLAFGPLWGTLYTIVGATLGAALSFRLAGFAGDKMLSAKSKEKWGKLEERLRRKGFISIVLLRLIPLFPFDLISYGAGIAKVGFSAFFFGTLIGIIPGTFAYNFLGSSFLQGKASYIVIAVVLFALISLAPIAFRKRFAKLS